MLEREFLKIEGFIHIEVFGQDGKLKDERFIKNTIVTVGKNYLAAWLAAASQAGKFMEYIGVGTGTTAANAADTALESALGSRAAGTISSSTNSWSNSATFAAGASTGAITEAGLFSASTLGTMFARQVFAVVNKGANDSLTLTWTVTFS